MALVALPGGVDTKYFIEGPGCLAGVPEMLSNVNGAALPVLLIQDRNTHDAAGEKLGGILAAEKIAFSDLILKEGPLGIVDADYERVIEIRDIIKTRKVFPVAVGSGTINDLVKRAAFELGITYACVGTAASVDGYCSSGASLVYQGYKTTMACPAPAAVAADTDVLRSAPYDMTASGYGDLYAKLAAGADWFLADRLGVETIHAQSWDLVQKDLPRWVAEPEKLRAGDGGALSDIFRGLTMSGCAMQVYNDSRPASGAEHLVSHVWEMEHLSAHGIPLSHGFKVAMGTVISAALMEALGNLSPEEILAESRRARRETWEERRKSIERYFPDSKIRGMVEEASRAKWTEGEERENRIGKLAGVLPEFKAFAREKLGSAESAIAKLKAAGCPVSPEAYGVGRERIRETVIKAQMIRKRYTILDALYEAGLLDDMLARLF